MRTIERALIKLDGWPWSAAWRFCLGLSIPLVFGALFDSHHSVWIYAFLFAGLLVALRGVPLVLRRLMPISNEAKEKWKQRRFIAKEYDSYQWQKLFWIGLGMLPHAFIGSGLDRGGLLILTLCLVGGGAGLIAWQKSGLAQTAG